MVEYIATPGWKSTPVTLKDWSAQLGATGLKVETIRESSSSWWLEIPSLRLRGLAGLAGKHVDAVNFELHDPDIEPALALIRTVVAQFDWELHSDEDLAEFGDDPEEFNENDEG